MSYPVASANDINTGGHVGMERAQESKVLARRDPGGSIRHSAQNLDITRAESQATLSRQQVTNITKMFDKKMRFTGRDRHWQRASQPDHLRVSLNLPGYRGIG
jgi:hypothetical protein